MILTICPSFRWSEVRQIWIRIPALHLIECVTWGKLLAVSDLHFPQCQMEGVVPAPSSFSSQITMYLRTQKSGSSTQYVLWLAFRMGIGGEWAAFIVLDIRMIYPLILVLLAQSFTHSTNTSLTVDAVQMENGQTVPSGGDMGSSGSLGRTEEGMWPCTGGLTEYADSIE